VAIAWILIAAYISVYCILLRMYAYFGVHLWPPLSIILDLNDCRSGWNDRIFLVHEHKTDPGSQAIIAIRGLCLRPPRTTRSDSKQDQLYSCCIDRAATQLPYIELGYGGRIMLRLAPTYVRLPIWQQHGLDVHEFHHMSEQ
jgi:hypothetical protein